MNCKNCNRLMVELFLTQACDHCDYGISRECLHSGYIVKSEHTFNDQTKAYSSYVFQTPQDADKWRSAASYLTDDIVEILSLDPFTWLPSRGTLKDVILADHTYDVFLDHRYEPGQHRAFIAPTTVNFSA